MRKSDALGALAVLTVGLLTLRGELGMLVAVVLAVAVYRVAGSELGPTRADVTGKVRVLRTFTMRGR